ncbi:hypothetical protein T484DRAFT_1928509, partial [Baffinella frigidus]
MVTTLKMGATSAILTAALLALLTVPAANAGSCCKPEADPTTEDPGCCGNYCLAYTSATACGSHFLVRMKDAGCPNYGGFVQTDFAPCSCTWQSSIEKSEANGCSNAGGGAGEIGENAADWDCSMAPGYEEEGTCSGSASGAKSACDTDVLCDPESNGASSSTKLQSWYAGMMLGCLAYSFYGWR